MSADTNCRSNKLRTITYSIVCMLYKISHQFNCKSV